MKAPCSRESSGGTVEFDPDSTSAFQRRMERAPDSFLLLSRGKRGRKTGAQRTAVVEGRGVAGASVACGTGCAGARPLTPGDALRPRRSALPDHLGGSSSMLILPFLAWFIDHKRKTRREPEQGLTRYLRRAQVHSRIKTQASARTTSKPVPTRPGLPAQALMPSAPVSPANVVQQAPGRQRQHEGRQHSQRSAAPPAASHAGLVDQQATREGARETRNTTSAPIAAAITIAAWLRQSRGCRKAHANPSAVSRATAIRGRKSCTSASPTKATRPASHHPIRL